MNREATSMFGGALAAGTQLLQNVVSIGGTSTSGKNGGRAGKEVVPGDYIVRVTVHEAASLTPQDWGGTSDPFIVVTCAGKTYQTDVVPKVNDAQFDASFIFEFSVRHPQELTVRAPTLIRDPALESLLFRAVDSNYPFSDTLIGSYEMELQEIYSEPKQEIRNQWLALVGTTDGSLKGYLRVSASVMNIKDQAQLDELAEADTADGELSAFQSVKMPSTIRLQHLLLEVEVVRAEGLPVMDTLSKLTGGQGTDPFVSVTFGVNGAVRTALASRRTDSRERNSDRRNPRWDERVQLPVTVLAERKALPTNTIRVAVLDHDFGRADQVIGQVLVRFDEVQAKNYALFRWFNLYGPAPGTSEHDAQAMVKGVMPGSQFRGRVLMRLTVKENKRHAPKSTPGDEKNNIIPGDVREPMPILYRCRAEIYEGFGLPVQGDVRVAVSLANVRSHGAQKRVVPEALRAAGGRADFMQLLSPEDPVLAPEDPRDAPDVFIELWDTPATKLTAPTLLAFARFTAVELSPVDRDDRGERPVVRVELARGPDAVAARITPLYKPPATSYRFRATIFQARFLPASIRAAAADPYVVLRGAAPTMQTSIKKDSTFPLWWEPLTNRVDLPIDLSLAPKVSLLVLDKNNPLRGDALLAWAEFDAREFLDPERQGPAWRHLQVSMARGIRPAEKQAEILASFELLEDLGEPPPRLQVPRRRKVSVLISIVGLRGLLGVGALEVAPGGFWREGGLAVTRPQIRVSVDSYKGPKRAQADGASADDREVVATEIRNHSGGDAPNFFQTLSLIVDMPEDRIFCPTLRIDVWDHRPLHAVLVGTAFVPLEDRLPQMAPWVVESDLQAVDGRSARSAGTGRPPVPVPGSAQLRSGSPLRFGSPPKGRPGDDSQRSAPAGGIGFRPGSPTRAGSPADVRIAMQDTAGPSTSALRQRPGRGGAGPSSNKASATEIGTSEDLDLVDEEWKKGRRVLTRELERVINCDTFEQFVLLRRNRPVGRLKGFVQVFDGSTGYAEEEERKKALLKDLTKEQKYNVRLYVIKTHNLLPPPGVQPRDLNPYVKVYLDTREVRNGRKDARKGTDDPDFRVVVPLEVTLPGKSKLQVQVWHAAPIFSSDVLLGQTEMDLEDRVLSEDWRNECFPDEDSAPARGGAGGRGGGKFLTHTPVEMRNLTLGAQTRGRIELLADIFKPSLDVRVLDVRLPPPEPFVMRVVVWGTSDIPHSTATGLVDMYVRLVLEGIPPTQDGDAGVKVQRWIEETDTHWRAKSGRGSFNWRSVFELKLPMKTPRLTIQVWDHDILTPNDFICQGGVLLDPLLNRAWQRYQVSKGAAGAVFHLPDLSAKQTPTKKLDHTLQPKADGADLRKYGSAWEYLCGGAEGTYKAARGLVATKGRGDGEWIDMYTSKGKRAGMVSISVTLMHQQAAKSHPAGPGRSDPNENPKLPAPERVHFNLLRPDLMMLDLLGPEMVTKIFVLILLVLFIYFAMNSLPIILTIVGTRGLKR